MAVTVPQFRSALKKLRTAADRMKDIEYYAFSALDLDKSNIPKDRARDLAEISRQNDETRKDIERFVDLVEQYGEYSQPRIANSASRILNRLSINHTEFGQNDGIPKVIRGHKDFGDLLVQAQDSMAVVLDYLDSYMDEDGPPALPHVRAAPIKVKIDNDVISLYNTHDLTGTIDFLSANRAREHLRETLEDVVKFLYEYSNVDRGYVRQCANLLSHLDTPLEDASIEAIGLSLQLFERMTRRISDELGGTVLDQVDHVTTGVNVLLNQFQEWQDFLSEQAITELDTKDTKSIIKNAQVLIRELEKPGAPVDPKIAQRLRDMIEPAVSGLVNADTINVALVCSMSNIFSLVSQVAIEHAHTLASQAPNVLLLGAAGVLINFSVDLIATFCPIISQFQPLSFVIRVGRYISRIYSPLKDFFSNV